MTASLKATGNNINTSTVEPCDAWGDELDTEGTNDAAKSLPMSSAAPAALPLPAPITPIPFPFCNKPDHTPGIFTRSALFRVERLARGAGPEGDSSHAVKAQRPCMARVDGPLLTLSDKRVFDAVVRQAKEEKLDLNEPLRTSLRVLASRMGLSSTGGNSLSWISDSLDRLARTRLTFRLADGALHEGDMLASVERGQTGVMLRFDPDLILPAFGTDKQFRINAKRRAKLSSPLSQWMHDFISTHTDAHDLTLDYLRQLCGYGGRNSSFSERLTTSMAALVKFAPEIVSSFEIIKLGRSSDHWTLSFKRGVEAANFFDPAAMKAAAAAKWGTLAKGSRKSGVAL